MLPPCIDVKSSGVDLTGQAGWHCKEITPADLPDNTNPEQLRQGALDMLRVANLTRRIAQELILGMPAP